MNYPLSLTKVTRQTKQALDEGHKVIVHQGGTRSGKTYGIIDLLIAIAFTTKDSISITSLAFPHLKRGAMRDWQEIMDLKGLYDPARHNKTDHIYEYPLGGYIEFFSLDQAQKLRGPSRDILFINEANLVSHDIYKQLAIRTKKAIILDYNPADQFHWIYDHILPRQDCKFIQSTYLDNPFLKPFQRMEIERDREGDPDFWRVYGLGERGSSSGLVYTHWKLYDIIVPDDEYFGLDFGFNNPCALIKESMKDDCRYWQEYLYENHLNSTQLIERIRPIVGNKPVYCDSDEQILIAELQAAGITAYPAKKSVKMGIDEVRRKPLFIHQYSHNLLKEIKTYRWRQAPEGVVLPDDKKKDEVVKRNDHCFTGDSMITTISGQKKIKDITINDYVLTSNGFQRVVKKWYNGPKRIKEYRMVFDTFSLSLCATPDHLIKTAQSWEQISKLKSGMMVNLINDSTEEIIFYNREKGISNAINGTYINMFGNRFMENHGRDSISTIRITIPGIIQLIILNLFQQINIRLTTCEKDLGKILNGSKNFIQKELRQLRHGTKARKESIGIKSMQPNIILVPLPMGNQNVRCAQSNSLAERQRINSAIRTVRLKHFEEGEQRVEDVYDLTVENTHEYFVNGVLVHNCMDAGRYAAFTHSQYSCQIVSYFS